MEINIYQNYTDRQRETERETDRDRQTDRQTDHSKFEHNTEVCFKWRQIDVDEWTDNDVIGCHVARQPVTMTTTNNHKDRCSCVHLFSPRLLQLRVNIVSEIIKRVVDMFISSHLDYCNCVSTLWMKSSRELLICLSLLTSTTATECQHREWNHQESCWHVYLFSPWLLQLRVTIVSKIIKRVVDMFISSHLDYCNCVSTSWVKSSRELLICLSLLTSTTATTCQHREWNHEDGWSCLHLISPRLLQLHLWQSSPASQHALLLALDNASTSLQSRGNFIGCLYNLKLSIPIHKLLNSLSLQYPAASVPLPSTSLYVTFQDFTSLDHSCWTVSLPQQPTWFSTYSHGVLLVVKMHLFCRG